MSDFYECDRCGSTDYGILVEGWEHRIICKNCHALYAVIDREIYADATAQDEES